MIRVGHADTDRAVTSHRTHRRALRARRRSVVAALSELPEVPPQQRKFAHKIRHQQRNRSGER